jgi:hypothetical protein
LWKPIITELPEAVIVAGIVDGSSEELLRGDVFLEKVLVFIETESVL